MPTSNHSETKQPFHRFTQYGKFSKIRWSLQTTYTSQSLSFVTSTYDEPSNTSPSLVLWHCETTTPGVVPGPQSEWVAEPVSTFSSDLKEGDVADLTFVQGSWGTLSSSSGREGSLMVTGTTAGYVGVYEVEETQSSFDADKESSRKKKKKGSEERSRGGINKLNSKRLHAYESGNGAECIAVDLQPNAGIDGEIASGKRRNYVVPEIPTNVMAVRIATGGQDGRLKVWDLRSTTEPEVKGFKVHSSDVSDVQFHPGDARRILTCSEDGTA
ncbi:hypothetical protein HDV05_001044, partial [Chytridiales sp. JEL 0842]